MSTESSRLRDATPNALPPGTRLGEYELLKLLGVGGFGIVYLAFDHALEREVAVKEYMPAALAGRTETLHVSLRSQSDAETFAVGLKSFVNEARLLARFDHPSLLKVHRFWEANGTAYMAMPVMRGRTVKQVRLALSGPPDEAAVRALLEPLLGAIEKLHSEGTYHRDIAPDNIQIEPDGHPVLLDFGAARRVLSDRTQTLTAILKPAYAPIEQYAEVGAVKQGPWTDIYSLGATLHFMLLARPPSPATARSVHDDVSALTTDALPGCSETFLRTVDWMLAPRPADRPQSVAELREVLSGRAQPPRRRPADPQPVMQWERTVVMAPGTADVELPFELSNQATQVMAAPPPAPQPEPRPEARPAPAQAPAALPELVLHAAPPSISSATQPPTPWADPQLFTDAPTPVLHPSFAAPPVAASLSAPPAGRSRLMPLLLGLGAVTVAAAGYLLWPPASAPAVPAAPQAAVAETQAAPSQQAAVPEPAASVAESAIATVVLPARAAKPAPAAQKPSTPRGRTGPGETAAVAAAPAAARLPEPARARAETPPSLSAPAAAAPEPARPVATGPEAKCGGRNPVRYFICMERECLRGEFSAHADCQKWRREAKRD